MSGTKRRLCRLDDIADGDAKAFPEIGGDAGIFVVRRGGAVYGYVNNCPHWRVSLDFMPGRFMNRVKRQIQCANHGARFLVENGICVHGPCLGQSLTPIAVRVIDGMVVLAEGSDAAVD